MREDNRAIYPERQSQRHFYEAWYLKLNRHEDGSALWLRFLLLNTKEFKQGNVWAIFFPGQTDNPILTTKYTVELSDPSSHFSTNQGEELVSIGKNNLGDNQTIGDIRSQNQISWNLQFKSDESFSFNYAPPSLSRYLSSKAGSPNVNLAISGTFTVNNTDYDCKEEPGSQGHYYGTKYAKHWAWAHCNSFGDEDQNVIFEIIAVKTSPCMPALKSAFVRYQGQNYVINNLSKLLFSKSDYKMGEWNFRCHQQGLTFEIKIKADPNRVVDVEYEDVDHSKLTCHNTKQASSTLTIYENNQVKDKFISSNTTAFEIVDRL